MNKLWLRVTESLQQLTDWSLTAKVVILTSVTVLLPFVLIGRYGFNVARNNILQLQLSALSHTAESLAYGLDILLEERLANIAVLAEDESVRKFSSSSLTTRELSFEYSLEDLENLANSNYMIESVYIMGLNGEVILSTTDNVGDNYSFHPYFQEGLNGNQHISDISISVDADIPVLYFSAPIYDFNNSISGVAVLRVQAEEIWAMATQLEEDHPSYSPIIIFDEFGIRLVHTSSPELVFSSVMPLDQETQEKLMAENRLGIDGMIKSTNFPELAAGLENVENESSFTFFMVGDDDKRYAGAAKMSQKPWIVIETIAESSFLASINQVRQTMIYTVSSLAFLTVVAIAMIVRTIMKPVRQLIVAAGRLGRGELDRPLIDVEHVKGDHIGLLMRSFESMRRELKDNNRNVRRHVIRLSLLHSIASVITSAENEDDLISEATTVIGNVHSSSNFGILLMNEEGFGLLEHKSYFRPRGDQPLLLVPLGEGISGSVAKNGEIMRVADVSKSDVYINANQKIKSELCIPLISDGNVLGVINLESEIYDAYNENDEQLVQTIADQISAGLVKIRYLEKVKQLAISDPLTDLYNHRHFFELAQAEFYRARRFNHSFVALMIDLDLFKKVNDTYGHAAGDATLVLLSKAMKEDLRDVDLIGRYGGEEFAVLLPETEKEEGYRAAIRLLEIISNYEIPSERGVIKVTASIGVAELWERCKSVEELFARADRGLYHAKSKGGNQVSVIE